MLVVEDEPLSQKLMRAVLEAEACEVRLASSAEEALGILTSFDAEVAVIDLILPTMSGLVLGAQLKSATATGKMRLIAVTAFNGRAAERMAFESGFDAYVKKPIDPDGLCRLLAEQLGRPSR